MVTQTKRLLSSKQALALPLVLTLFCTCGKAKNTPPSLDGLYHCLMAHAWEYWGLFMFDLTALGGMAEDIALGHLFAFYLVGLRSCLHCSGCRHPPRVAGKKGKIFADWVFSCHLPRVGFLLVIKMVPNHPKLHQFGSETYGSWVSPILRTPKLVAKTTVAWLANLG